MPQGVISKILPKVFNGKTFYSFALKGQDGFYGMGVKRPPQEGTYIRFNDKKNSRGYLEVDGSIEIVPESEAGPISGVAGSGSSSTGPNKGSGAGSNAAYWDRKETRDIANDAARELGASRNTAISIIDLALKNEIVKLPAAAKREEFFWTLLDRYTDRLMGKDKPKAEENIGVEESTVNTSGEPDESWS